MHWCINYDHGIYQWWAPCAKQSYHLIHMTQQLKCICAQHALRCVIVTAVVCSLEILLCNKAIRSQLGCHDSIENFLPGCQQLPRLMWLGLWCLSSSRFLFNNMICFMQNDNCVKATCRPNVCHDFSTWQADCCYVCLFCAATNLQRNVLY